MWISRKRFEALEKRVVVCEYASNYILYTGFSKTQYPLSEVVRSIARTLKITFSPDYGRAPTIEANLYIPPETIDENR